MTTSGSPLVPDREVGETYAAYIESLVASQDERKASLESRGMAVITTSGSLTTLLFGLVALLTKADTFHLPKAAHGPLTVALIAFVIAAVGGLATNLPLFYKGGDPAGLRGLINHYWDESESTARLRVAATSIKIFERASRVNEVKAWVLVAAMAGEVVGVAAVAIAVSEIVKAA